MTRTTFSAEKAAADKSLGMTPGATAEQNTGAQLEIDSIRRGRESRLSPDDRSRRDALTVDLGSVDAKKRAAALRELRSLYD